jgi:tetratricopeptide (TPR) repeat protein
LFVIARNSSFTYKGRAVDVKQVGRELGVRYVLEGSVRKAANRVRISGQLIDASSGTHIWADRFEGMLDDIFDLQDQVAASVVGPIAPQLENAEIERAKRKQTDSLDAYDYFLRGMASFYRLTRKANDEALRLFSRAIELDPDFAVAHAMAAWCFVWRKLNGWMIDREWEIAEGGRLARQSVELGRDDAIALSRSGHAIAHLLNEVDEGAVYTARAVILNPNLAVGWYLNGWVKAFLGELDAAIEHQARAMRLSPLDPTQYNMQIGTAFAHMLAGRYEEASLWIARPYRERPDFLPTAGVTAASHAFAGRMKEAEEAMARLRRIDPTLRISNLRDWYPLRPIHLAQFAEGLRKAGLPE